MDPMELVKAADPKELGNYLTRLPGMNHSHDGKTESIRKETYQGHQIVVRTSYQIEVDGKPLMAPLGVDNDGAVHCHSLPNYESPSAIGMVKLLIDQFPDDFSGSAPVDPMPGMHHHDMPAMAMKPAGGAKAPPPTTMKKKATKKPAPVPRRTSKTHLKKTAKRKSK